MENLLPSEAVKIFKIGFRKKPFAPDLKWMAVTVRQLPATGSQSQNKSFDGTLANFINQTVSQQKLNTFLTQMTPKGEDEIRVRFKAVPFQDLIVFVSKMKELDYKGC